MSRLDRLVVLLETGSTPFIRNTAADQLSDLAKAHPEDILSLLGRVYPFLKSPKWETRIAAARAFGGIVNNAELWDPNSETLLKQEKEEDDLLKREEQSDPIIKKEVEDDEIVIKKEREEELKKMDDNLSNLVSFDAFSLHELIKCGTKFLASKADDNCIEDYTNDVTLIGRIKRHRSSVIPNEKPDKQTTPDEKDGQTPVPTLKQEPGIKQEPGLKQEAESKSKSLSPTPNPNETPSKPVSSARLKAMQKRRAKANAKHGANKVRSVDISQSSISRKMIENGEGMDIDDNSKNGKDSNPQFDVTSQQGGEKLVVEAKVAELSPILSQHAKVAGLIWQFQGVYELLLADLFDDKWEIRHGAALGLRELVKKHGGGAGRVMNKSLEENNRNNAATLEDLAVRLCVLFVLDRFGDYVSDTVVAPVRESGAQTLAALLIHLNEETVLKVFDCLNSMVLQKDLVPKCWEAKHGGILGVR